jgi:pimeloyl-ACP methyl ester carboxylesterase
MSIIKRVILLIVIGLCLQFGWYSPARSAPEAPVRVKEFNFVFLHGAGGNVCSMQLLADSITEQIPAYIAEYELANPDTEVRVNMLLRCYPNDVDIKTWAENIAESVDEHLPGKQNLIFIGHSMGGKTALYAVANDVGGLADRTAMVVTINSPIRSLQQYYFTGGASILDYSRAVGLLSDSGVTDSIIYYDSAEDGRWVAAAKHWLAFISGEGAPLSQQFNVGGVDAMPRNMDDNIIPISAQYTDRADVVYYGEHSHNDFANLDEVAGSMAEQILRYIFGGEIECSVLIRGGNLGHAAGWLPGTDYWEDVVGEVLVSSGSLRHTNDSFFRWQDWEDVVGESPIGSTRSSYRVSISRHFPFVNSIEGVGWLIHYDTSDCQLLLKTRAAPRSSVQVDWSVYRRGLLPADTRRDHYEVEIVTGTPLTTIRYVSWLSGYPDDLRLQISSEAESPFRWFKAEWRVYFKESRYRKVIDEMTEQASWVTALQSQEAVTAVKNCCD